MEDGTLEFAGINYSSVSSAAQAVSGNKSEPGWEFWGAPSGDRGFVSLFNLRERLRSNPSHDSPKSTPSIVVETGRTDDDAPEPALPPGISSSGHRRRFTETIRDLVDGGLLTPGQELSTTRIGRTERAIVQADGSLQIGGTTYTSPSAAAKAVTGNSAEPGWEFWATETPGSRATLFQLRENLRATSSKSASGDSLDGN